MSQAIAVEFSGNLSLMTCISLNIASKMIKTLLFDIICLAQIDHEHVLYSKIKFQILAVP